METQLETTTIDPKRFPLKDVKFNGNILQTGKWQLPGLEEIQTSDIIRIFDGIFIVLGDMYNDGTIICTDVITGETNFYTIKPSDVMPQDACQVVARYGTYLPNITEYGITLDQDDANLLAKKVDLPNAGLPALGVEGGVHGDLETVVWGSRNLIVNGAQVSPRYNDKRFALTRGQTA